MKNKKAVYFLLPVVLAIWGMIGYRIFSSLKKKEAVTDSYQVIDTEKNIEGTIDTFSINADYTDPFLHQVVSIEKRPASPKVQKENKPIIPVAWPDIIFRGIIKNPQAKRQTALIVINGKDYLMKAGEKNENIMLARVFKDSVEVVFGKDKKILK